MTFCARCGTEIKEDALFCASCGSPIDSKGASSAVPESSTAAKGDELLPKTMRPNAHRLAAPVKSDGREFANQAAIIGIVAGCVALVAIVCVVCLFIFGSPFGNANGNYQKRTIASPGQSSSMESESAAPEKSSQSTSSSKTTASSNYLLPESNSRYYTETELNGMSTEDLFIARNEIFARYGRGFKDSMLVEHFNSMPWYTQKYSPEEFDAMPDPLNAYEKANSNLIISIEQSRNSPYLN